MISVKELANSLGVSRKTIYALRERGEIPCYRIGTGRGTLRFDFDEVKRALRFTKKGTRAHKERPPKHLL
ncbi:helix-turn-helix domain-containing protein [Rhodopirellula sp. P2]|uniref:helix-turn-helix domain-containing protein n=1 Tax=Rhodopirellula sp. P2 TaxID=2127060 RepID=UPI003FD5DAC9